MLKITCTFMALVLILSILHSTKVESRVIHQNFEGIPFSRLQHLRFRDGLFNQDDHNDGEQDGNDHVKRKSDFLLSLYGLPYTLVNKRGFD